MFSLVDTDMNCQSCDWLMSTHMSLRFNSIFTCMTFCIIRGRIIVERNWQSNKIINMDTTKTKQDKKKKKENIKCFFKAIIFLFLFFFCCLYFFVKEKYNKKINNKKENLKTYPSSYGWKDIFNRLPETNERKKLIIFTFQSHHDYLLLYFIVYKNICIIWAITERT